jgi:hypothetical protein
VTTGVDLSSARSFLASHGRVLDRHRLDLALGDRLAAARVLGALEGYRNPDGGYGWGLEPDLRDRTSQPAGALHAFEAMADAAARGTTSTRAIELADWCAGTALGDGALPFALPLDDATACAPFWADADPATSSLQITAAVVAQAQRLARHQAAVADHHWVHEATSWCVDQAASVDERTHAIELMFVFHLLDLVAGDDAAAATQLDRLAALVPVDGRLPVAGGAPDEALFLLDLAPWPETPLRGLLAPARVLDDLDRLEAVRTSEGGWEQDFQAYSPAAGAEWKGYRTVMAVQVLVAAGRTS